MGKHSLGSKETLQLSPDTPSRHGPWCKITPPDKSAIRTPEYKAEWTAGVTREQPIITVHTSPLSASLWPPSLRGVTLHPGQPPRSDFTLWSSFPYCDFTMKNKLRAAASLSAVVHCLFVRGVSSRLSVTRVSIFRDFTDSMGTKP